ncbi:hypothetical protein CEXT_99131 [Caerostris extrusa]|uniref:Uncharacterized protein n=1 Tax=Caerostris extrusa TaxID=172846 RepID=A0AAV4NYA4_CAEEX|nr:hypothetical protein CEXT_99131 [Caerostris extrusa]
MHDLSNHNSGSATVKTELAARRITPFLNTPGAKLCLRGREGGMHLKIGKNRLAMQYIRHGGFRLRCPGARYRLIYRCRFIYLPARKYTGTVSNITESIPGRLKQRKL